MEGRLIPDNTSPASSGVWAIPYATPRLVRVTNGTTTATFRFVCEEEAHKKLCAFVQEKFGDDAARGGYVVGPLRKGLRVLSDKDVIEAAAANWTIHVGSMATLMPVYVEIDDPEGTCGIIRVPYGTGCLDALRRSVSDHLERDAKKIRWNGQRILNDAGLIDAMMFFNASILGCNANPEMLKLTISHEPREGRESTEEPVQGGKSKRQRTEEPAQTCARCGAASPGSFPTATWRGKKKGRILCVKCYATERKDKDSAPM